LSRDSLAHNSALSFRRESRTAHALVSRFDT
jgi:hypothetical protein